MTSLLIHGGVNDTVRAATALHAQDGTHDGVVLNKDSEKLLAQFGQATKVMSDLAVQGKYPHPAPDYLAALTSPPGGDMWSVGMLFKYGPSGDTWNPKVLSDVGGAMLDWRAKQLSGRTSMRPDYMPRTGSAGYYGFYTSPGINNWYQSLGLDPRYTDPDGGPALVAAIEANDPSVALMNRVGENAQASRALLTQPDGAGLRHAEQLVDYQWQTPGAHGPHDESDPIRRVLTLAATDRSAANQDQSGIAADNILTAAAKEQGIFAGRDDSDKKEQYQTYPQGTAVALAAITATWAKDLGATSLTATDGTHGYDLRDHVLVSNATDLTKAMQLFAKDNPGAAAMFDVTLHEQVSEAAGSKDATDQLTNMGNLAGLFTKAKVGNKYTQAQQLDEKHKFNTYLLTTAGSLFGYIPAPTAAAGETLSKGMEAAAKGLKYSQNLVTLGRTVTAPQTDPFSVDNAGKQEKVNEAEAKQEYRSFSASIVQGLIRSGQIPPPTNRPWYNAQTGTLAPHAVDDPDFQGWWSNTQGRADYLNDFKSGFDTGEVSPDGR
ncbi:hypothetical protein [Streptomyces sp. SPB162]|uniref:hypothetical protein n=1 Tax=Streptomyces sp. SPB162 TaxID=2940560 RepID=UPI00240529BB|nr:hypothetical protein [Streptomyces sp. SPB162]MDF9814420.1 hypothetical protein [Streptomyces sp. SPB162]